MCKVLQKRLDPPPPQNEILWNVDRAMLFTIAPYSSGSGSME